MERANSIPACDDPHKAPLCLREEPAEDARLDELDLARWEDDGGRAVSDSEDS